RRRHTRSKRDWSSDVCSSDLVLRRFLRQSGYTLHHVMNITDVDDKIIRNSSRDGLTVKQYTAKYEKAFLEDASTLNIEQPVLVQIGRASCRERAYGWGVSCSV